MVGQRDRQFCPATTYSVCNSNPEPSSRNSIGVLPPISIAAASASTRNFGFFDRTGGPVKLMKGEHLGLNGQARLLVAQELRDQR